MRTLAGYGVAQDKIAQVLRVDAKSVRKHCREELDNGATEANAQIAQSMYQMAIRAPYSVRFQAAKFWLAARAGWRDVDKPEPLVALKPLSDLSDEAWRQLCSVNKFDPDGLRKTVPFPGRRRA